MTYKTFIIDMFNLAYRKQSKISDPKIIANNVINYIDDEIKQRLEPDGTIYLTFDPIPKSDIGMDKNFKYSTERQSINSDYKSNRVHNPIVYGALKLLKKYYTYRGDKIKTVISDYLEADDYVEGILNIEKDGMVALVSNDMDWSRYISDRVQMINNGFDKPFTKEMFFNEKGYLPTIAAITLDKALFGDPSDNIEPVLTAKNKIYKDQTAFVKALIKEISKTDLTVKDIEKAISKINGMSLLKTENRSFLEEILAIVSVSKYAMNVFENNLRLIKSRCTSVSEHIYSNAENESYNKLIDATLGRGESIKQKFRFGNIS